MEIAAAIQASEATDATLKTSGHIDAVVAGYNVNLGSDVLDFAHALDRMDTTPPAAGAVDSSGNNVSGESSFMRDVLLRPLNSIDNEAQSLAQYAEQAAASEGSLSPGEVVLLTARAQEFMFHSQLAANIANRSAEGLQQLFRQQS